MEVNILELDSVQNNVWPGRGTADSHVPKLSFVGFDHSTLTESQTPRNAIFQVFLAVCCVFSRVQQLQVKLRQNGNLSY